VLDTLMLSAFLHDHTPHHSLDAIAERFGVPLGQRHSALGDALATAAVFLKMIDALAARGVVSLNQALAVTQRIAELRARQMSA
jgi:DNA polymerase-3 subunit epsilon